MDEYVNEYMEGHRFTNIWICNHRLPASLAWLIRTTWHFALEVQTWFVRTRWPAAASSCERTPRAAVRSPITRSHPEMQQACAVTEKTAVNAAPKFQMRVYSNLQCIFFSVVIRTGRL